jgi:hypothetical protein
MKVVVDLLWGGLLIAACSLFVAAVMYHNFNYASIGMICAGIASVIQMSEQYHKRKRSDLQNRMKGWKD